MGFLEGVHNPAKLCFPQEESREGQANVEIYLSRSCWQTVRQLDVHLYGVSQGREDTQDLPMPQRQLEKGAFTLPDVFCPRPGSGSKR